MKGFAWFLVFAACALLPLSAQSGGAVRDRFYDIVSDGDSADTAEIARELELRFAAYNRLFRFDPASLAGPLKVRSFQDKAAYDQYVSARLGSPREGAVYLHYEPFSRRELVINPGSPAMEENLAHQAFIQFLRAFIPNPPGWIRDGFALYFTPLRLDPASGQLTFEENDVFLERVKSLGKESLYPRGILMADTEGIPGSFQTLSWSLAVFFLNNGEDYYRTLTESFRQLSPSASSADNSQAVMDYISRWTDMNALVPAWAAWLDSQKTLSELLSEAQRSYEAKDAPSAEEAFRKVLEKKSGHPTAYYYLALMAYEGKNFDKAEEYYLEALQNGGDFALIQYARGLNAMAAGRNADALDFLRQAVSSSPERYKDKADPLIYRLTF